jgi:hypothetical protein
MTFNICFNNLGTLDQSHIYPALSYPLDSLWQTNMWPKVAIFIGNVMINLEIF